MTTAKQGFFSARHRCLEAFLFGALISATFMVVYLLLDGSFLFYGDFNVQQIPFYIEANRAVRAGSLMWNSVTDLGVNFIGTYSFYLLGSPFFWMTVLLPFEWVGYSLGYIYILKFACATLTAYMYLQRFVRNKDYALIGSVLYAFSGYGIYNIFFNHFHEALVFFPLLLIGMEMLVKEHRYGVFAIAVFINAFVNYYFFFGEVIFCVIYFVMRSLSPDWDMEFKHFVKSLGLVALESIIGLGLSCIMLLPALSSTLEISRSTNFIDGWNALMYSKPQRYGLIFQTFFFPPDIPARPNFFPDSDSKWASTAGWLPLFSMTGVIAFLQSKKKNWLKRIIWVCIFIAFIPVLNSAFSFFNYGYYSRWFYMPILMMALASAVGLEDQEVDWKRGFKWTALITLFITIAIGFMPVKIKNSAGEQTWKLGLYEYADRFFIYVAIALLSLLLFAVLFYVIKRSSKHFTVATIVSLTLVIAIYANVFIMIGRGHSYDREWITKTLLEHSDGIDLPDRLNDRAGDYRIDVIPGSMDNLGLFWGESCICAFNSIVPGSVFDYYDSIGVQRSVGSRPDLTHQALRALTSVKWMIDPDNDESDKITAYSGWTYVGENEGCGIYRNENYIPMGFTYDNCVTAASYETLSKTQREKIMLLAMVLEQSQIEKYSDVIDILPITEDDADLIGTIRDENSSEIEMPYIAPTPGIPSMSSVVLEKECSKRASQCCKAFNYTSTGFEALIDLSEDELVFFSVPHDRGWSATVNGEPVDVERVNVGFMAVRVPAGENSRIVFSYIPTGLMTGIRVTCISAGMFIIYIITCVLMCVIRKRKATYATAVNTNDDPLTDSLPVPFETEDDSQSNEKMRSDNNPLILTDEMLTDNEKAGL